MSDYRRWISYIYAYENGVKKKSAGYAKLELKDGKLAMTLHITPDGQEGRLQICMYKCHAGSREGVLFGSIEKRQGGEGIQFLEDAADLRGSGLLFQEMNGLLLYDDKGKYLISSWEDEPIEIAALKEIVEYLERERATKERAGDGGNLEEEKQMENIVKEEMQGAQKEVMDKEITDGNAESEDLSLQSEEANGIHITETSSKKREQEELMNFSSKAGEISAGERSGMGEIAAKGKNERGEITTKEEAKKEEISAKEETKKEEIAAKEKPEKEEISEKEKLEQKEITAGENLEKNTPTPPSKLETRVFSCLSAMYPFEHQEFERSVRMEPQDIGLLPREMWKYASNSFLLHSYYAYYHILFVRKLRKEQRNCYLMLPGIYNPKEQHMAQLFGFSDFCPVRKKALQQGDFGYWYMEVVFPKDKPQLEEN